MSKLLITGGCSFSECISKHIDTWPRHLAKVLPEYNHISTGMGSQGNGLISRKIIYQVTEALKTTLPDDILVGIMWSGPDRHDFYANKDVLFTSDQHTENMWMENPTKFIKDSKGAWVILNHHWNLDLAKMHYRYFHNTIGAEINTYEHILRVQWFLKLHNIKYFMSTFTSGVLNPVFKNHPDIKHLHNQIDFDNFLPVTGEYEWCNLDSKKTGILHPTSEQHFEFTQQVILPHIKKLHEL